MKKCILYSHAGSNNHGCEALIRTAVEVIKNVEAVYSGDVEADKYYGLDKIVNIREDKNTESENIIRGFIYSLKYKLLKDDKLYFKKIYRLFLKNIKEDRIYISVGGDNYCYHFSEWLKVLNIGINDAGAKTVLWGCSINPDELDDSSVVDDLKKYALITARESITYDLLKARLPEVKVEYVPDTAFKLATNQVVLPDILHDKNIVGLNISPVIINSANNKDEVISAFVELVDYIVRETDYYIELIPHVVIAGNDDREVLEIIRNKCEAQKRIIMVQDADCSTIKGYISKCDLFIGARTHATIAAYSSFVPTLAIGYSVKSLGIAKDLFGTFEHYVLPVKSIDKPTTLIQEFKWLNENKESIRKVLKNTIPKYTSQIDCAVNFLKEL